MLTVRVRNVLLNSPVVVVMLATMLTLVLMLMVCVQNLMTYLVLQMILHILYEGGLTYMCGATPGKRLFGLAVAKVDASPLTLTACLVRAVLKAAFWCDARHKSSVASSRCTAY